MVGFYGPSGIWGCTGSVFDVDMDGSLYDMVLFPIMTTTLGRKIKGAMMAKMTTLDSEKNPMEPKTSCDMKNPDNDDLAYCSFITITDILYLLSH